MPFRLFIEFYIFIVCYKQIFIILIIALAKVSDEWDGCFIVYVIPHVSLLFILNVFHRAILIFITIFIILKLEMIYFLPRIEDSGLPLDDKLSPISDILRSIFLNNDI